MSKAGSKKYDVKKLYAKALKLLKENKEICFESILHDCMGVSHEWFYKNIMRNREYSATIKDKLADNRGAGTLDFIRDMNASDAASCIIARGKILNKDIRAALTDRGEVEEEKDEIPKITFGKQE